MFPSSIQYNWRIYTAEQGGMPMANTVDRTLFDITPEILELAELKPIWGQGIEEPLIAIQKINIPKDNIKLLSPDKNPTLKLSLKNGIDLIKFKSSQEEYENLIETGSVIIDVVGRCERNVWNGNITPQIIVEEYQIISKLHYF